MVRPADTDKVAVKLVQVKGVQAGFPLYGTVELEGGRRYRHALVEGRGALVRRELLEQLGLKVGDRVVIGGEEYTLRGTIVSEPGQRMAGFSFASRILVDYADLAASGLLTLGSRADRGILLKVREPGLDALVRALRRDLIGEFASVRTYRGTEDHVGEEMQRSEDYLSLVGLVIAILGGVSVWSVTRTFIQQRLRSIAVLKCVGATSPRLLAVYLLQILMLGLAGSLLGVGLGAAVLALVPRWTNLAASVPHLALVLTPSAVAQGIGVGLLVSILFALVPIVGIRTIRPAILLRDAEEREEPLGARVTMRGWWRNLDRWRAASVVVVAAGLLALVVWQAGSFRVGAAVAVGFAAVAATLQLASYGLVRAIAPLARSRSVALRHAVLRVVRAPRQTRMILLVVGLGSFFVIGVRSMQANLLDQLSVQLDQSGADMFLVDIQRDQVPDLSRFLDRALDRGAPHVLIPVLRARVVAVKGREVDLERPQARPDETSGPSGEGGGQRFPGREFTVTYRDRLEPNERVVEGRFWPAGTSRTPEVSIEEGLRDRFRINVGDTMRFDVLGRPITARVTSVRRVDWRDARRGGFMFVFRPGVFDAAPVMFIAAIRAPSQPALRARMQHDLLQQFPNVSVIDLREILTAVGAVLNDLAVAVTVVGAVVLASGVLILIGSIAMTRFQRIYEAAVFRTLGAGTRLIATMLLVEYGLLGLLAGLIGSIGSIGLTWWVTRRTLDIPWTLLPMLNIGAVLVTCVLVAVVGLLASVDVLRSRPLATLRGE
jgi:putative ABC transport system permease protein